jgi:CRP/FNR family transcriptional regulator, cyclic AMP receptor protein
MLAQTTVASPRVNIGALNCDAESCNKHAPAAARLENSPPDAELPDAIERVLAARHVARAPRAQEVDPLYLLLCSVKWQRKQDASAGWELVQALRLGAGDTRAIAAALLAKTEHTHIPVRDLRRTWGNLNRTTPVGFCESPSQARGKVAAMNKPYGLEVIESCLTCKVRKEHWFCQFSANGLKLLDAVSRLSIYPSGTMLFIEGQMPRGAYVLCSGRAKLSTTSREGKVLILRMAEAGEVLGLSAAIAGQPFELTAEAAEPCEVNFLEREALIRLIENNGEIGLHASLALSREFQSAYRDIHDLVLARSSAGKLAKLLLSWTPPDQGKKGQAAEIRIQASLTHEEMAQMIGSSRETVTRLLSDLKKRELIRLEGSTLVIRNRTALEAMAV